MVKILSQTGISLADTYEIEGSIAGIAELKTEEGISLVHGMAETIFSERLSATIRRATTGAIAQNLTFDLVLGDLPRGAVRVLNVAVITDDATRADNISVSLRDPTAGREMPIFAWQNGDPFITIRLQEDSGVITGFHYLQPLLTPAVPSLLVGLGQPQRVSAMAFRGTTTAFGAGTVTVTALLHIAGSFVGGISSKGLPIPGW